jgi:hypothetical protein
MQDAGSMEILCAMGHVCVIHADDLVSKKGKSVRDRGIENSGLVLWLISQCAYMWFLLHRCSMKS